jgi:DNA polymerase-3 subunit delta
VGAITKSELREQVRSGMLAPVYTLFGQETFLRDLAARTIAERAFQAGDLRDFNDHEYSLTDADGLRAALASADQLPMMASHRVIRVNDVRVGMSSRGDTLKEEYDKLLDDYLSDPSPASVVIFVADELNGNRKLSKLLKSKTAAVEFEILNEEELFRWADAKVTDTGSVIDDAALRHLLELVGSDLRRLHNEIAKLSTAAQPDKPITVDLVDSLISNSREIENFELTDHLVAGRKIRALEILKKLLDDGTEPIALLGLISYNFRRLLMAKEMMANGADRSEVAKVVKLRYRDQEPFLAAARRADLSNLTAAIKKIAEADLAIKTSVGGGGPKGSRMQIEVLVCELAVL